MPMSSKKSGSISMSESLITALHIAFRAYDEPTTTETERDAILIAMSEHSPRPEAESAARILQHRREASKHQLQLKALLGGIGGQL